MLCGFVNFHGCLASLSPTRGREAPEESAGEELPPGFVSAVHLPIGWLTFPGLWLVSSEPCSVAAFRDSKNLATPLDVYEYNILSPQNCHHLNIVLLSFDVKFTILLKHKRVKCIEFWSFRACLLMSQIRIVSRKHKLKESVIKCKTLI